MLPCMSCMARSNRAVVEGGRTSTPSRTLRNGASEERMSYQQDVARHQWDILSGFEFDGGFIMLSDMMVNSKVFFNLSGNNVGSVQPRIMPNTWFKAGIVVPLVSFAGCWMNNQGDARMPDDIWISETAHVMSWTTCSIVHQHWALDVRAGIRNSVPPWALNPGLSTKHS